MAPLNSWTPKMAASRCNGVAILSRSWDMYSSGFGRHFEFFVCHKQSRRFRDATLVCLVFQNITLAIKFCLRDCLISQTCVIRAVLYECTYFLAWNPPSWPPSWKMERVSEMFYRPLMSGCHELYNGIITRPDIPTRSAVRGGFSKAPGTNVTHKILRQ